MRTTSLSVKTIQGEEYVFRSFENREYVLDIILSYHSNRGATINDTTPVDTPASEEVNPVASDKSFDETDNDDSAGHNSSPVPHISNELQLGDSQHIGQTEDMDIGGDSVVADSVEDKTDTENNAMQWEKMKQHTNEWESAVANLELSCKSVKDFFDLFLSDDATNSLKIFQVDYIGDKNVSIEAWKRNTDGTLEEATDTDTSILRMIQFEHKSGISMAKVTRQQIYHCYGSHSYLKNITKIKGKGVPDAFFVEDMWFVESAGDEGIIITVKFRTNFTKSTMLRSIIESRTTVETKQWYRTYTSFVRQKMNQQIPIQEENIPPADTTAQMNAVGPTLFWDWFGSLVSSCHQFIPSSIRQKIQQKAPTQEKFRDWFGVLVSSVHQYVSDISAFFQNAPISLLFIVLALFVYRLKMRVMMLETSVEELEHRLFELEKS